MTPYEIIYCDPPWSYRDKANAGKRGAGHKYPTMTLDALADQMSLTTISVKVGKSEAYVTRRLKLCELVEPAKVVYFAGRMGLGQAEAIARLRPEDQTAVLDHFWPEDEAKDFEAPTVGELRNHIQREIVLDLEQARFRRDDAKLVKAAGPCSKCPKRSGAQPALFEDFDGRNLCLDRDCYETKVGAHWAQEQKRLQKEHGVEVRLISGTYKAAEGVLQSHHWQKAEEGDDGAILGLVVADWRDEDVGASKWIVLREDAKRWDEEDEDEAELTPQEKKARAAERAEEARKECEEQEAERRRAMLERDIRLQTFREAVSTLEVGDFPAQLVEVMYLFAHDEIEGMDDEELQGITGVAHVNGHAKRKLTPAEKLRAAVASLVNLNRYVDDEQAVTKAVNAFAKAMGVDLKAVKRAVEKSLEAEESDE